MASSGKKKTTMAKLNREAKMRERRMDKAARRDARKQLAADVRDGIVPAPDTDHTLIGDESDAAVATAPADRT
jgi:predicted alternative tryptophan synthase beta-subunit